MHTEEDTAPWWWDERAAVVDMAMPWMASSAMAREGASARGRRERVGTVGVRGSGWIKIKRGQQCLAGLVRISAAWLLLGLAGLLT